MIVNVDARHLVHVGESPPAQPLAQPDLVHGEAGDLLLLLAVHYLGVLGHLLRRPGREPRRFECRGGRADTVVFRYVLRTFVRFEATIVRLLVFIGRLLLLLLPLLAISILLLGFEGHVFAGQSTTSGIGPERRLAAGIILAFMPAVLCDSAGHV